MLLINVNIFHYFFFLFVTDEATTDASIQFNHQTFEWIIQKKYPTKLDVFSMNSTIGIATCPALQRCRLVLCKWAGDVTSAPSLPPSLYLSRVWLTFIWFNRPIITIGINNSIFIYAGSCAINADNMAACCKQPALPDRRNPFQRCQKRQEENVLACGIDTRAY